MTLAHRIRLVPTQSQVVQFTRACGTARFAYNWALAEWRRQLAAGQTTSEAALRRQLNAIKLQQFPWMREVTKNAPQQAIKNLGRAYSNFFNDLEKHRRGTLAWKRVRVPTLKRRGRHDAFRADNGPDSAHANAVLTDGKRVRLPIIGWVKMREAVRFPGRIRSVTVSRQADSWFASFAVDVACKPLARKDGPLIGVDLGIATLATFSDGDLVRSSKPLSKYLKRLVRLSRSLSRKRLGSHNRAKARTKLARLHRRLQAIRIDGLHKATTALVRRAAVIVIEDLNVSGMLANRRLARATSDVALFEFRRQLKYKASMTGTTVIVANRWYPSSKLCSACHAKNEELSLGERTWTCKSCGAAHHRDVNAANNLARYPESWAGAACGAEGAGDGR